MAHRRLSIIDLTKSAAQPMISQNKNIITYNGEVYNFLELKKELSHSWNFKTNSDTECILAGYEKYFYKILDRLEGMFSFAIWNEKNQTLFCARD